MCRTRRSSLRGAHHPSVRGLAIDNTSPSSRISVKSQAFLDVSAAQNPALSYGALGIVGLGFTSLSTVDALVNHTGSDTGRSLLYNAFNDNATEPNYIAFSLQRSSQADDDVEGTFSIGASSVHMAGVRRRTDDVL